MFVKMCERNFRISGLHEYVVLLKTFMARKLREFTCISLKTTVMITCGLR